MTKRKDALLPRAWQPTADERAMVETYVGCGLTQGQIAEITGRSVDSLARHCRAELDSGVLKANAKVAATLFNKAIAGDNACMIFWLKTRAGWRDVSAVELSGKDGEALFPVIRVEFVTAALPPAE